MRKLYFVADLGIAAGKQELPEWYVMFQDGWNEVEGDGKYLVDAKAWDLVRTGIERRGNEIVFDYEHQTLKGGKAPAAGWCKKWRYTQGVGIEAKVDWTEEAAAYLAKDEYRFFSPVFYVRDGDKRLAGVHSVALTNTPKTNNLKPLLAKLGEQHEQQEDEIMLKKLLAKLALGEDATEEQALAAIDALTGKKTEVMPAEVVAALDLKETDGVSVVVASINALKQAPKAMVSKADFDALQAKIAKRDADDAVAAAMTAGKITPDQKEWASDYAARDLAGFQTFVAKAPVVIPVDKLPGGGPDKGDQAPDQVTLQVAKMMGVTAEDIKTYGGMQ
ncbi:MAG: phage protease [Desulfobulbaceae bacterium]